MAACFLLAPVLDATTAAQAEEPPAAAEEVRHRSACAASGQQILAGNFVGSAVYQEQFSRFNARTKRCYVEMRVQTIDRSERSDRSGRYLYDGETKELLAFAEIRDGKKSGRVFDLNHRTLSFANAGFDDASEYIYAMMTDER